LEINAAIDHEAIDKHRNRIAELEEEVDALNDEIDGWKGIKKVTAADCAEIAESWECEANQNCEGYISNMIKQKYGV
jgi:hypothetical protein